MENSEYSIFQQIAGELEGNRIDKALWTKAFCDADGNASLTRARYIKLRAAVLDTTGAENLPSTLATVATVDSILSPTDCEAQESALINYEKDWPDIASVEHLRSLVEAKIYKRSLINALALELNQIDLDLSPTDLGADAVVLMTKFCNEWPYVSESVDLLRN